jgi:hypothetical protein
MRSQIEEENEIIKNRIINNFSKDFISKYHRDVNLDIIVRLLMMGQNPYEIIERLISNQVDLINCLNDFIDRMPPKTIIVPKDLIFGMDENKPIGFIFKKEK